MLHRGGARIQSCPSHHWAYRLRPRPLHRVAITYPALDAPCNGNVRIALQDSNLRGGDRADGGPENPSYEQPQQLLGFGFWVGVLGYQQLMTQNSN